MQRNENMRKMMDTKLNFLARLGGNNIFLASANFFSRFRRAKRGGSQKGTLILKKVGGTRTGGTSKTKQKQKQNKTKKKKQKKTKKRSRTSGPHLAAPPRVKFLLQILPRMMQIVFVCYQIIMYIVQEW